MTYEIFHTPGKRILTANVLSQKPLQISQHQEFLEETTAYIQQVIQETPVSDQLLSMITE